MLKKQETKRQLKQAGRNREIVINNMRKQLYRRLQAYEIMEAAMHQDPASDEDVEEFYTNPLFSDPQLVREAFALSPVARAQSPPVFAPPPLGLESQQPRLT